MSRTNRKLPTGNGRALMLNSRSSKRRHYPEAGNSWVRHRAAIFIPTTASSEGAILTSREMRGVYRMGSTLAVASPVE